MAERSRTGEGVRRGLNRPYIEASRCDTPSDLLCDVLTGNRQVLWGDGRTEPHASGTVSHIYRMPGVYLLEIAGQHNLFSATWRRSATSKFTSCHEPSPDATWAAPALPVEVRAAHLRWATGSQAAAVVAGTGRPSARATLTSAAYRFGTYSCPESAAILDMSSSVRARHAA